MWIHIICLFIWLYIYIYYHTYTIFWIYIHTYIRSIRTECVAAVAEKGRIIWYIRPSCLSYVHHHPPSNHPRQRLWNARENNSFGRWIIHVRLSTLTSGASFLPSNRVPRWCARVRVCICAFSYRKLPAVSLERPLSRLRGGGADVEVGRTRKLDYVPNPGRWVVCFHAAATRQFIIVSCFSLCLSLSLSLCLYIYYTYIYNTFLCNNQRCI